MSEEIIVIDAESFKNRAFVADLCDELGNDLSILMVYSGGFMDFIRQAEEPNCETTKNVLKMHAEILEENQYRIVCKFSCLENAMQRWAHLWENNDLSEDVFMLLNCAQELFAISVHQYQQQKRTWEITLGISDMPCGTRQLQDSAMNMFMIDSMLRRSLKPKFVPFALSSIMKSKRKFIQQELDKHMKILFDKWDGH